MPEPADPERRGDGKKRPKSQAVEALAAGFVDVVAQAGQSSGFRVATAAVDFGLKLFGRIAKSP
jgi:hypothetical protein